MSSLAAQKPWTHDPQCLPIPWREAEEKLPAQLRFAWSMGDGVVTPSPPIARAMMMTKLALEAAGHLVIDMGPVKEMVESTSLAFALWAADGGVDRDFIPLSLYLDVTDLIVCSQPRSQCLRRTLAPERRFLGTPQRHQERPLRRRYVGSPSSEGGPRVALPQVVAGVWI
jgi:Asp-tRNA(Asn)/Glu-tRNA(Gln) amidotransferase A subunit family amidase